MQPGGIFHGPAAAGKSYLLQETFEVGPPTDGTNISGYNSWAGDSTDNLEIDDNDTVAPHGGSFQMRRSDTDTYAVYKTWTNRTSGKFTVDFWVWLSAITSPVELFILSNGALSWPSSFILVLRNGSSNIEYLTVGDTVWTGCSAQIPATTWTHLEVEVDLDTDTFLMWFNGELQTTSPPYGLQHTGGNVDRLVFSDNTSSLVCMIDDVEVYTGARVAP
jgi:hypothetical protein